VLRRLTRSTTRACLRTDAASGCGEVRRIPDGVIAQPSESQFSSSQAVIWAITLAEGLATQFNYFNVHEFVRVPRILIEQVRPIR
jgi:hypothetical protein